MLDGRDIGTVICPEAEAKLFVTASDEARAARRQAELGAAERSSEVLADLRARDARDAGARRRADGRGQGCALARHHGFLYRRGRRRGRRLREEPDSRGRGLSPAPRHRHFGDDASAKTGGIQPPGPKHDKLENWMPAAATMDDFEALLNESFELETPEEGTVVKGTVLAIEAGQAIIDIGYKMEGRVDLKEFTPPGKAPEIAVGDIVEVYLDRVENARGEAVLSREKARREEAWDRLEKAYEKEERVEGAIFGRVKGGFTVDLGGAVAFLPGSQVDVRPVRDAGPLMHMPQPFQILKMDRRRGNIVVSRRAVLEESPAPSSAPRSSRASTEGDVIDGVVKNITEYGAFVDLGGVDGLLHVTDMAWRRVNHPSEILGIGETVKVQVIKINKDTQRISLGMKQLQADPWDTVEEKFPIGSKHTGRVTNITDYGAFVELEPGIEGLVHVSEMSWTKKNVHPGKIVSTSQEVEVVVLEIDGQKRRVSLGLKQTQGNPWENFAADPSERHPRSRAR